MGGVRVGCTRGRSRGVVMYDTIRAPVSLMVSG